MKKIILFCQQRLNALGNRLRKRVAVHAAKKQHNYWEFVPKGELDSLHLQLTEVQEELYDLQCRPQDWKFFIYELFCMPDEQLRENTQSPVQHSRTGKGWETVTGFCCLGGCDIDVYSFQSEREALLFSAILKTIGYQAPHNVSCPACYENYMAENLGGVDSYAE